MRSTWIARHQRTQFVDDYQTVLSFCFVHVLHDCSVQRLLTADEVGFTALHVYHEPLHLLFVLSHAL